MRPKALVLFSMLVVAPVLHGEASLVPQPAKMESQAGELVITADFGVKLDGACAQSLAEAAERLKTRLTRQTGISFSAAKDDQGARLTLRCEQAGGRTPLAGEDESYRLEAAPSGARIEARRAVGLLRGIETFLQLVAVGKQGFAAPAVLIDDKPRFSWRGISFDSSRHFMPVDSVKRTLDAMAAVKMNAFHWHLSDDQGVRVESLRYPKFQQLASDGLYYTQAQIRDVIAHAASLGIRVIPEFDIPGHTTAWFAAYPELASGPGPYAIERGIGILDPAMDPTREEVYEFLDGFFGEMAALFPDPYFHIGGDEVNGKAWNASAAIQEFIRKNNLKDNHGLQAYFNGRLLKILSKHGKTMIGWDEVLHPGVPREIVIQSWRGRKALADAARQGYKVILSNGYYMDLMQPAWEHYAADPLAGEAAQLPPEAQARILGGEACMWSEFISPENLDNRLWPRTAAVAERLWSPADTKDIDSLYSRLDRLSLHLESLGLTHRTNPEYMMRRMAGSEDISALQTLAEAVEPVKGYARSSMRKHLVTKPLNRFIDSVPPESVAARAFGADVKAALERKGPAGAASRQKLKGTLTRWRENHAQLTPLLERSAVLAELRPLSTGLAEVAAAGLEALDSLESGKPLAPERKQALVKILDKAGLIAPQKEDSAYCEELLREEKAARATIQKRCFDPRPAAEMLLVVTPHIRLMLQ